MLNLSVQRVEIQGASELSQIEASLNTQKGAIFSSGSEYPGRHSKWDIAFTNPALEFISKQDEFLIKALNSQGEVLLKYISAQVSKLSEAAQIKSSTKEFHGRIKREAGFFTEEDRSRQASVFSVLRSISNLFSHNKKELQHFGFYGAFGFDLVHQFEEIQQKLDRPEEVKDCHLYLPLDLVLIERQKEKAVRLRYDIDGEHGSTKSLPSMGEVVPLSPPKGNTEIESDHLPGEFEKGVEKVIEGTKKGDYFEVVLSQSFETRAEITPVDLFTALTETNPSPYLFLINFGDEHLVGSSPEIYVRITGREFETCPIAGTVRRGDSALEDADRVKELISSLKDESELTMCTDVDRNDMARVCVPGSVKVIGRRQLEFYSHLIHTVDHVMGELDDKYDSIDAFQSHMWACTVTGAPKPAALQCIEDLEKTPRRWFSGAVGFMLFNGDINTGITLRTANIKDGRISVRAGATLLYGSDPVAEEAETRTKARAIISLLEGSSQKTKKEEKPEIDLSMLAGKRILLIDCRDSFIHNLASYLRSFGCIVQTVRRNFAEEAISSLAADIVLLSPGPGSPKTFDLSSLVDLLNERKLPAFGVCLGHQGLASAFGAKISTLPAPCHGKASIVEHYGDPMFTGLPAQFEVGRYHSLYVLEESLPDCLEVTSRTVGENPIIMSIRHRNLPFTSVQFHPESLMTLKGEAGHRILANGLSSLLKSSS